MKRFFFFLLYFVLSIFILQAQSPLGKVLFLNESGTQHWDFLPPSSIQNAGWILTGNDLTSNPSWFLGTTSNHPLNIYTNNTPRLRILNTGSVGSFGLLSNNGTNYVGFSAPNGLTNDLLFTLPASYGTAGQALVTDGFGNLYWTSLAGGISGSGSPGQVTFWNGTTTITGDNNLYWDNTNSRLGIGTTTPTEALDISGNLRFSGSLMPNGSPGNVGQFLMSQGNNNPPSWTTITETDPIYSANIDASSSSMGNILRHNGTKYVPVTTGNLTSTTTGVTITGGASAVIGNGTTIDIATANGTSTGLLSSTDWISFNNRWSLTGNSGTNSNTNFIGTTDNQSFVIRTNNIERITVTNNGNVGIGTTNPYQKLSVSGDIGLSGGNRFIGTTDNYALSLRTYNIDRVYITSAGNVGIGTTSPGRKLSVAGDIGLSGGNRFIGTTDNFDLSLGTNNTNIIYITSAGNVGIGTTSPGQKLSVVGDIGLSGDNRFIGNTDEYALSLRTNNTDRIYVTSAGNVGIGTTEPGYRLQVGANGDGTSAIANAWNTFSDLRLKTNINLLTDVLPKISQINAVNYNWKNSKDKRRQIGFIAQDVEKVFPELVSEDDKGIKSLDYSKFTPILLQAIKEQQQEIEKQRVQIEKLQKENEELKRATSEIESLRNEIENIKKYLVNTGAMGSVK